MKCPNCQGEKGFWIDEKDPRNPDFGKDDAEDYFEPCDHCNGTGTEAEGECQ